jgi:hypothetical protein
MAVADADVHVLLERVHLPVDDEQFRRHARMGCHEARQQRREHAAAEGGGAGDAQPPLGLALQVGDVGLGHLQLRQNRRHAGPVQLASGGQRERARRAREQPRAQRLLEPRDVLARRRGRDPQLARGRRDAAAVDGLEEGFDAAQLEHGEACG